MACKYYYDGAGALIAVEETRNGDERPKLEAANSQSSDTDKRSSRSHLSVVSDKQDK
ncbi:hypothetical protein M8R20_06780 [Pseudomonas sp. R2.Fl]|nr:hypothetical protein [Pseudomonas sp. R2.Fl]